jgi:hypothetical protein
VCAAKGKPYDTFGWAKDEAIVKEVTDKYYKELQDVEREDYLEEGDSGDEGAGGISDTQAAYPIEFQERCVIFRRLCPSISPLVNGTVREPLSNAVF